MHDLRGSSCKPGELTPDAIKFSQPYRAAHVEWNAAFGRLQAFNKSFVKTFKRELKEEREQAKYRTWAIQANRRR